MSRAGIKQIGLCDAGTLGTTPTNPHAIGLRGAASIAITPFKTIKDHLERELRNMKNFKIEAESLQSTMKMIKAMIDFVNLNCDAQIQSTPQSTSAGSDDVFQFAGLEKLGLGFEFNLTAEKRSLKMMLEGAFEFDRATTLIDAADSNSLVTLPSITGDGVDFTAYRAPYFLAFESPTGSSIINPDDIIERKMTIKTKGKKDQYNKDIVDYLSVTLELTGRKAAISDLVAQLNKDMGLSILVKEKTSGSYYDAFAFNTGALVAKEDLNIKDDERSMKITFQGDIPFYDVDFLFGDGNGGSASDTVGSTGGTMRFGF